MVSSYSKVIVKASLTVAWLATLGSVRAQAAPRRGVITEAAGVLSEVKGSSDLWLRAGRRRFRVNLDDFGRRRKAVCAHLLGSTTPPKIYGVLNGRTLEVADEFFSPAGESQFGYVEIHHERYRLGLHASNDRPDSLSVRYGDGFPAEVRLTRIDQGRFALAMALARHFDRREPGDAREIDLYGRMTEADLAFRTDALFINLGANARASVVVIEGEVVNSPGGAHVVTDGGMRLRLLGGPPPSYTRERLLGLWFASSPADLKILSAE